MLSYTDFYKEVVGFAPYSYQIEVERLLSEGKNVILSVPTGAGKTLASIMPYLYFRYVGNQDFPQKMIYSLPLRALTNSIYSDVKDILEHLADKDKQFASIASIQTGEYSEDPYFEREMVFSTIDQTLSNFLSFPLALSHSLANINAGAIIGSYMIFDEFHLLDTKLSMSTTIGLLQMLKSINRFCMMTATLSETFMSFLRQHLVNTEIVTLKDFPEDVHKIQSLIPAKGKKMKKCVHVLNHVLDSREILNSHHDKTLVICNRVEKAQKIYHELEALKQSTTELLCLHSRYFDSDRKKKEEKVKRYFGKHNDKHDVILISTQVIEAGMDISCDTMFTELSPINSILQRAGRCARFAYEYGDIFIADVAASDAENGNAFKNAYLPYDAELCIATKQELQHVDTLDDRISKQLVDRVLSSFERKNAGIIIGKLFNKDRIANAWADSDKIHYSETIRDIESVDVILYDIDSNLYQRVVPFNYESISIYKWSLIKWVKQIIKSHEEDDWVIAKASLNVDSGFDIDWGEGDEMTLERLDIAEAEYYNDVIFLNNKYFDYDDRGLFVSDEGNRFVSPDKEITDKESADITYTRDSYKQHVSALLNCYKIDIRPRLKYVASKIESLYKGLNFDQIIECMIAFHDFGKLNDSWQRIMLAYEREKLSEPKYFDILAHTDYNPKTDQDMAKRYKLSQKPPHAGIGAKVAYDVVYSITDDETIASCVSSAILRHHSPDTESSAAFCINEEAMTLQKEILKELDLQCNFPSSGNRDNLDDIIPRKNKNKEWILYFVLVRILRLCDQKATANIQNYLRYE